jgi:hypothetical protein
MADFLDSLGAGVAQFQDTFGVVGMNNGASLIRAAALGKPVQGSYKVGFNGSDNQASINNRVYIKIPSYYCPNGTLTYALSSEKNLGWQGIYFPVTPTVRQDYKANWVATAPQQSNYAIYSYNNTDVGTISVSGQFPVQTPDEGYYWLATINALRSLTKMRTGRDQVPGAPPPVCRFFAYGANIYDNIPVVIGDFSIELPSDVDYVTSYNFNGQLTKVPTLSTITMNLIPVYSRREMSNFSVDKFVKGTLDGQGYL